MSALTQVTGFAHMHDLPCYRLQYQGASLLVSLYGGHLLSYQPTAGQELLWVSPLANWQGGQAIRGGVPICWPWFGPAAANFNPNAARLANHGLVRNRLWTLLADEAKADSHCLKLGITLTDLPYLPAQAVTLELSLQLYADQLSITLNCSEPMLQQAALHSYFAVNDLATISVTGIGDVFQDKVTGDTVTAPGTTLSFNQEIDRIYLNPSSQLQLKQGAEALAITQHGFDSTIVWNPWQARSKALADLPDDGYQAFVCVETARLALTPAPLALTQTLKP